MATAAAPLIKSIDVNTVHRICSGQVVLTLAVAVKELVENSLDSGATAVGVRLKEYGSESVEVTDNGHGISPLNFENLCLKHYTSKIEEFDDLLEVQTFGFRGEALSSLCALSTLSVTTCEKGQTLGWKLDFDHHGKLVRQIKFSRQPGTTVTLSNLFASLPVRHKEFIRHLKREFTKMINMLTGYCLISKGISITCTNLASSKLSTVLSTRGGAGLKDNFTLVFGLKSWQSMLEIPTISPDEEYLAEFNLTLASLEEQSVNSTPFKFEGFISTCTHGQGRSCSDRQYYFINGRPCDPVKVIKLVNEIYHSYNRNQYPSIVLNIITRSDEIDINVTPDKRQLMVTHEKLLLATIKASLSQLFRDVPSTFAMQNTSISSQLSLSVSETSSPKSSPISRLRSSLAAFAAKGSTWDPTSPGEKRKLIASSPAPKQKRMDDFVTSFQASPVASNKFACKEVNEAVEDEVMEEKMEESVVEDVEEEETRETVRVEVCQLVHVIETAEELETILDDMVPVKQEDMVQKPPSPSTRFAPVPFFSRRRKVTVPFSLEQINSSKASSAAAIAENKCFMALIRPDDAAAAEAELSRQIGKTDFEKMEVVGQFNLGFIIARLNNDLFIVDQHAADEKYHFETLQQTTQIRSQKLACPKPLQLTAANESLLMDNTEIFRRNGFEFLFNKDEDTTKRTSLISIPMSGGWVFGPSDVDELLFLLQDSPVNTSQITEGDELSAAMMARYRPSRIRAMFASRACRKAVMVGTALTPAKMKKYLQQLSQLKHPWNCPHGRPTMRHLINIEMLR